MPGQHRAGQVVEAGVARRAAIALPMRLAVVPAVTGDLGAFATRAADVVGPAVLAHQLVGARVIDQRGQVHQGWHGRPRRSRRDASATARRLARYPRPDHPETRQEPSGFAVVSTELVRDVSRSSTIPIGYVRAVKK